MEQKSVLNKVKQKIEQAQMSQGGVLQAALGEELQVPRGEKQQAQEKVCQSLEQLVGHTPLFELSRSKEADCKARVLAKLEFVNPAGSAKDRVAAAIIRDAIQKGALKLGATIIESTSGNTGIGLAALGTAMGYKSIIVMPDSMSKERITLMEAYGAEVVLTPGALGMQGANDKAAELLKEIPGSYLADQFNNPANAQAHYESTGPEIWEDSAGAVDIFVAGIGTGGTVSGVGRYLKERKPDVQIVGIEPASSPLLTEGTAGPHKLQGIGANFVPSVLDTSVLDCVMTVTNEAAYECTRKLGQQEGLLVGISSGAAVSAAFELARKPENAGKTIVVFLPDTGTRYLSTDLYQ